MQLFGIYTSGAYEKMWRGRHLRENELKKYFQAELLTNDDTDFQRVISTDSHSLNIEKIVVNTALTLVFLKD